MPRLRSDRAKQSNKGIFVVGAGGKPVGGEPFSEDTDSDKLGGHADR